MKKLLLVVVMALGGVQAASAAPAVDAGACSNLIAHLSHSRDTQLMTDCMDFYFLHDDLDAPSCSWNYEVALGYRIIALEPNNEGAYMNTVWMLYSQWVMGHQHPEQWPNFGGKADEALALLAQGAEANAENATYFYDAGNSLMGGAWYFLPNWYAPTESYFTRADEMTTDLHTKVRVRLNLGHLFRHGGDNVNALVWYKKVLEVDPQNAVALRCIKELGA